MVLRTVVNFVGKRVPLIKFRKGGLAPAAGSASSNQASSNKPVGTHNKGASTAAIEDWELPPRYWRKPIDPVEMEYINRGGPA